MSRNLMTRSMLVALVAGGLSACDQAPSTAPLQNSDGVALSLESSNSFARTTPRGPVAGTPRRPVVDTTRCRVDDIPGLTPAQIEAIRELYAAFNKEVADLLRFIAAVEKEAREALANGATHQEVAAILARADEAKAQLALAEQRLRDAINEILNDDQRRRHCIAQPLPVVPKP